MQHAYTIANQAGASFRADIVNAFQAGASCNGGATAPSTPYAGQLWADSTSGWLKQRDQANAAWIKRWPLGTGTRTNVASAATLDLTANAVNSDYLQITGTTGVTAVTLEDGQKRWALAGGAFTLTNGANLILPGGANYTCAAGDQLLFLGEPSSVVRVFIWKADGTPVVSSTSAKVNNFRLTLTSALPVTTADVTSAGTIYACPYNGNQISLYTGGTWVTRSSAQFSLALSALTSGKPYDVFCYDNAGTPTLEFLAWTNDTTRATALAYQDGVLVKSGDSTRRYLGTFYTTSTTTTEDSAAKRFLYNYYNRQRRVLRRIDSTASWTYTTNTIRQANAAAANQVEFVQGVAEDAVTAVLRAFASNTTGNTSASAGIGIDSTTAYASNSLPGSLGLLASGKPAAIVAEYKDVPAAGRHYLAWLEASEAAGTTTWYGTDSTYKETAGMLGEVTA